MNTLRVCATMGLGLSLVFGLGCKSSSSSAKDAGPDGRRDASQNNGNRDSSTSSGTCEILGNTYQSGQTVTINCVTYTCTGNNNVTTRGTACIPDAAPDTAAPQTDAPTNRDTSPGETRAGEAGGALDVGGKDLQPGEVAQVKPDVGALDTATSNDSAPPTPDAVIVNLDAPPVETCKYDGQKYLAGGGVQFACGSCMCVCDASAIVVQIAGTCPAVDAQ